jgi:hypothetical protein
MSKVFEIRRYTSERAEEWDAFVERSKNGTFLFDRRYMDYHSDRFKDYSLMFYYKNRLYALLPANIQNDILYSHQGLTYGGLVMGNRCTTAHVRELFYEMNAWLREAGIKRVVYKHIPWVYTVLPAEEDLFALTNCCKANLSSRDVASVVILNRRLKFSTLRSRCVKKAQKAQLEICESNDFAGFWSLLEENLMRRHQAKPVHSLKEIQLLRSRFPEKIRLFVALKDNRMLGGTVLYMHQQIVKTQYISANEEGRKLGALDLLFNELLEQFASEGLSFFDFGTSNQVDTDDLNDSLIFQKEGFGGRAICYDTYEWKL